MDRFVIRGSNKEELAAKRSRRKGGYKQMSLHALKGVVVMEDIAKLNHLLRVPNQQPAILRSSLEQLSQKLPSREILKSTKIGHAVKRLSTHSDKSVSQLARRVVSSWKNHFEEKLSRPSLDVRCDHATTRSRETVRKHIRAALLTDAEQQSLVNSVAESLEFEIFRQHRQLMSNGYRRTARQIVFNLRRDKSLCQDVADNKYDLSQLVTELRCGREFKDEPAPNSSATATGSELVDVS